MADSGQIKVRCTCGAFLFWVQLPATGNGTTCHSCKRLVTWSPGRLVVEEKPKKAS